MFTLYVPDPSRCPEPPQSATLEHREQHGVNDNKAGCPVVDGQPVPGKLGNQLIWKHAVFDKELHPLSPAGFQLTNKQENNNSYIRKTVNLSLHATV